jgi:hypothetical protein
MGYRWRSVLQARLSPVRAGSVSQRSRTGSSGHQRSPTVRTNRRSSPLQLKQQDAARGRCGLWSRRSGRRRRGSRWAATGVRNDRGARPRTVEDHDRRSCHRRPLTWRFSRVFPGPQHTAFPCRNARYRSRTEEARGSNPLTSTNPDDQRRRSLSVGRFLGLGRTAVEDSSPRPSRSRDCTALIRRLRVEGRADGEASSVMASLL